MCARIYAYTSRLQTSLAYHHDSGVTAHIIQVLNLALLCIYDTSVIKKKRELFVFVTMFIHFTVLPLVPFPTSSLPFFVPPSTLLPEPN